MSELHGDLPWIIGAIAAMVYFAVFETLGFIWPARFNTLSHAVYTIGAHWSLSIFLMGGFSFGLAVHFFWHWCPPGSISTGELIGRAALAFLSVHR